MQQYLVQPRGECVGELDRHLHGSLDDAFHFLLDPVVGMQLNTHFLGSGMAFAGIQGLGRKLQALLESLAVLGAQDCDRHAELVGHRRGAYGNPVALRLVRHVEHEHRRQSQVAYLQCKRKLAIYLRGVEHEDHQVDLVVLEEMAHDLFIVGKTVQVINAG